MKWIYWNYTKTDIVVFRGIAEDLLKPANIKVTISQHDLTNKNSDAYQLAVKNIFVHPGYICRKPKDDIAILELNTKLTWSEAVLPACFPFGDQHVEYTNFNDVVATVAGWGWTNENSAKGNKN